MWKIGLSPNKGQEQYQGISLKFHRCPSELTFLPPLQFLPCTLTDSGSNCRSSPENHREIVRLAE